MVSRFLAATLVACLLTGSSYAGLQSAIESSLEAARVSGVIGAVLNEPPEGALFVDPLRSTRAGAVHRNGPELIYDSTTGNVQIIAPPMLGPADEFGQRLSLAPTKATFYFGGERGAHRGDFPGSVAFVRHHRIFFVLEDGIPLALIPSFWAQSMVYEPNSFNGPYQLRINSPTSLFSGFEFSIPGLLKDELSTELFTLPPIVDIPAVELYALRVPLGVGSGNYQPLPEISVVIDYVATSYSLLSNYAPHSYRLLAQVNIIPEPANIAIFATGVLALLQRRSRSAR